MPIPVTCPECRAEFEAPDTLAGLACCCRHCQAAVPVPRPPDPAERLPSNPEWPAPPRAGERTTGLGTSPSGPTTGLGKEDWLLPETLLDAPAPPPQPRPAGSSTAIFKEDWRLPEELIDAPPAPAGPPASLPPLPHPPPGSWPAPAPPSAGSIPVALPVAAPARWAPRERPPQQGSAAAWIIAIAGAALLLLGGVVIAVVLLSRGDEDRPPLAAVEPKGPPWQPDLAPPPELNPAPKFKLPVEVDPPKFKEPPEPKVPPFKPGPAAGDPPARPPVAAEPELPPPPRLEIRPAPLAGGRLEKPLPAPVAGVAVGGGGRFLVLHLRQQGKLALFDANEARVVHYFPTPEGDVKFAAGMNKLLVGVPGARVIQRWDLLTRKRELTVPLTTEGQITEMAMGSASRGPLLVALKQDRFSSRLVFIDPATLREKDHGGKAGRGDGAFLRASADGTLFTMRNGVGGEPHTVTAVSRRGGELTAKESWGFGGSVLVPSPDGRFVYSASGVFTRELRQLSGKKRGGALSRPFIAAAHGPYFMRLEGKEWNKLGGDVSFFLEGQERPLARLDGVEGVAGEHISYGKLRDTLTHDQRVFFIPDARLVVTIPASNDRLILYRFDLEAAMEKSGIDYLVVTSRPPDFAVRGAPFAYQLAVKSKKGGVTYRVDSGPEGMKVGADGRLTWAVPAGFAESRVDVILTVGDAAGQEIFHTFRLAVVDAAPGKAG
jgi:hypothetical protein